MTTIIDPYGTPEPVYTRSGTTIQTVAAAGNSSLATATPIVAVSGWSVVLVEASTGNDGVILPEDAQIGDVVEVHGDAGNDGVMVRVYTPDGFLAVIGPNDRGVLCRKTSATAWRFV
jgi:hypothetical protein